MKIALLYGTETGNSEMVCEDMRDDLGEDFDCTLDNLMDVSPEVLDKDRFHIIVTSTYGNGDLPSQVLAFEAALVDEKPDLTGLSFAIFGLGDQVFSETYNNGSKRLSDLLVRAGATMVGERGLHDASSLEMPEDIALPWLQSILPQISANAA